MSFFFTTYFQFSYRYNTTLGGLQLHYAGKVKSQIPNEALERAQSRVDQLLDGLRSQTRQLASDAPLALWFDPEAEQPE